MRERSPELPRKHRPSLLQAEPGSKWQALLESIRGSNPALRYAGAVSVFLGVVGGSWLVFDNRRCATACLLSRHSAGIGMPGIRVSSRQLTEGAEAVRKASPLKCKTDRPRRNNALRWSHRFSSWLVPPAPRHASHNSCVGRGAQIAHIEIQLEARDEYPRFRAAVQTRSGREVLVLSDLTPRRTGAVQIVSMDVPASVLGTGEYELALKGLSDGQGAEDIGYYYFSVKKL